MKYYLVIVQSVIEEKFKTLPHNTIQAEGLGSFLKSLGRISAKACEKFATNVLKNQGRALEITSNFANSATTKSPKAALSSLLEVISFYHTAKTFT